MGPCIYILDYNLYEIIYNMKNNKTVTPWQAAEVGLDILPGSEYPNRNWPENKGSGPSPDPC